MIEELMNKVIFENDIIAVHLKLCRCDDKYYVCRYIRMSKFLYNLCRVLGINEGYKEIMARHDEPMEVWFKNNHVMMIHGYDGNRYAFRGPSSDVLELLLPYLKKYVNIISIHRKIYTYEDDALIDDIDTLTLLYRNFDENKEHITLLDFLLKSMICMTVNDAEKYYKQIVNNIDFLRNSILSHIMMF